ncbi:MAG TPA: LTA synthase family protein [Agriterribacter sp.]|nr:LTA synthase family protein [Chitinophagaceae bacterium]HRP31881.1 LTA synthase family protein [Agriterribacter sp.]
MQTSVKYYLVFLYRLFVVLLIYMLCRYLFFIFNKELFRGITADSAMLIMQGGIKFDIAALFYFNGLFIFLMLFPIRQRHSAMYQRVVGWTFFLFNGLAILLNCIDIIYYRFTLRRSTRSVFGEFEHETNKWKLVFQFLKDYWYIVLLFIGLIWLMKKLYGWVKINPAPDKNRFFYLHAVLFLLLSVTLAVGGIRGDFKHSTRPITISNAGEYVNRPNEIYLVLNTPFCMVRTWDVHRLREVNFFDDTELKRIYSPVHFPGNDTTAFRKRNVVVILLESFSKEVTGFYNHRLDNGTYEGYTPFLDSLMQHSKVYWNSFANGRKSIDALPSVLGSIPAGMDPFVLTPYASDSIYGLPHILRDQGYHTSFFHGAPNGSMGFSALIKLLGVEHYYGKDEYNNDADFDGMWGIWDEPFFQFFANTLGTFKEPFFSTVFSVSSHHPFKVPAQYANTFRKGPIPVLECVGYTDMALRKFFETAKQQPWFKNTLFVISADHSTVTFHPEYQTPVGDISIPIVLFQPEDSTLRGVDSSRIIQQIDIMPSVLSYLHYPHPYFAFGKNVFDRYPASLNFGVSYLNGYRWFEGDYLLFFDGKKSRSLHNYKTDPLFTHNLLKQEPERVREMERNAKAFVQQYTNRLIRNELVVGNEVHP